MREETVAAMQAVEELLRGGVAHSTTSIGGAIRSTSRSATSNLLDKMAAIGVVETFDIIHKQHMGGADKRITLRCARATGTPLHVAIGQQALDLGGDICLPKEQEAVLAMLRQNVVSRYPKTKNTHDKVWSATKLQWWKDLDKMQRLDGAEYLEQLEVLTWLVDGTCRDSKFWSGQVRSAQAWRKHYAAVHGAFLASQGAPKAGIDEAWDSWRDGR